MDTKDKAEAIGKYADWYDVEMMDLVLEWAGKTWDEFMAMDEEDRQDLLARREDLMEACILLICHDMHYILLFTNASVRETLTPKFTYKDRPALWLMEYMRAHLFATGHKFDVKG